MSWSFSYQRHMSWSFSYQCHMSWSFSYFNKLRREMIVFLLLKLVELLTITALNFLFIIYNNNKQLQHLGYKLTLPPVNICSIVFWHPRKKISEPIVVNNPLLHCRKSFYE
jgi:hypothetical protein